MDLISHQIFGRSNIAITGKEKLYVGVNDTAKKFSNRERDRQANRKIDEFTIRIYFKTVRNK